MSERSLKYEFTAETKVVFGVTLRRIRALRAFGLIAAGELGGWLQSESNLCQYGNAWVSDNAQVSGDARVSGNAHVSGKAWVYDAARVSGNAHVSGYAHVSGNAWVSGDARVSGNARVSRPITCTTRSDRYTFTLATDRAGYPVVIAGCRYFSFPQAREHWQRTRAGTPLGEETFAILDMLERIYAIQGA